MTFDEMVAIAQELRANGWTISEMALIDVSYDVLSGREPERYRLQAMRRCGRVSARRLRGHPQQVSTYHPSERRANG